MFIFRTHFVLKTCGETTLLHAVEPMLGLARDYCGFDIVDVRIHFVFRIFISFGLFLFKQIFYSRRKFLRPELQKAPHTSFEHEVKDFGI
jgi:S-adenosylmethionine decarboxylase